LAANIASGGDIVSALDDPVVFNLLGAALLRTGWTIDANVLWQPCLVVKSE
jgi:hypothetical protein